MHQWGALQMTVIRSPEWALMCPNGIKWRSLQPFLRLSLKLQELVARKYEQLSSTGNCALDSIITWGGKNMSPFWALHYRQVILYVEWRGTHNSKHLNANATFVKKNLDAKHLLLSVKREIIQKKNNLPFFFRLM